MPGSVCANRCVWCVHCLSLCGMFQTHSDSLVQRSFVMSLELCPDLHQVDFTAGHHDPGQHLLLGAFTLRETNTVSAENTTDAGGSGVQYR